PPVGRTAAGPAPADRSAGASTLGGRGRAGPGGGSDGARGLGTRGRAGASRGALRLGFMASRPLWAVILQWTLWLVLMTAVMRWLGRTRERRTDDGTGTLA